MSNELGIKANSILSFLCHPLEKILKILILLLFKNADFSKINVFSRDFFSLGHDRFERLIKIKTFFMQKFVNLKLINIKPW